MSSDYPEERWNVKLSGAEFIEYNKWKHEVKMETNMFLLKVFGVFCLIVLLTVVLL